MRDGARHWSYRWFSWRLSHGRRSHRFRLAPAFTAPQLLAPPARNWVTNGGTLYNQRYSPLALINRDNVKDLRALWRTAMGSGTTPGHAGQAQILAYEGVLYVSNGANDVFALDVETGQILWTFKGNPEPRAGSPIGRASRGVAIGEGKVFVHIADGRIVALDQRTGAQLWVGAGRELAGGFRDHLRAAVFRRHGHHRIQRR